MNRLLPAPKLIETIGDTFKPDGWQSVCFPQEVEIAVKDILQLMKENWDYAKIEQISHIEETTDRGYHFYIGNEPNLRDFPNKDRQTITDKPDAYHLTIQKCGAYAWSSTPMGLYYALQTFQQLLNGEELVEISIIDWPDLAWRGVHIDAKGERPGFTKLIETIKEWSRYKLNMVLFEYEGSFPYTNKSEIVDSNAFTPLEIQELQKQARDHFITIIPLVQTLGHVENILKHPRYASLRENGEVTQFCSSHEEVFDLIHDMIHEVAENHPNSPWIHIGGDEAWYLGSCPDCAEKMERDGMDRLYIDHINRVIDIVKQTGKLPIIWDDGLRRLQNREEITRLDRSCIIQYWDYQTCGNPLDTDWIRFLQSHGFQVIGGSAMRGASGMESSCPQFQQRYRNSKNWGYTANRFSLPGVIATSWGRYGALKPLIEPFDLGWYGAIAAADHFWNAEGMEKESFDQSFAQVFLGETTGDFPKWLKRFEKGLLYQPDWLEGRKPVSNVSQNFIALLDLMWKWKSEEQFVSRKLELLEARLYRISEDQFPEWERWRMVDRAHDLQDRLISFSQEISSCLKEKIEPIWAEEYVLAFTQKYLFRVAHVIQALTPMSPRPPQTLVKIGADYG